jgi:hypothetical protein
MSVPTQPRVFFKQIYFMLIREIISCRETRYS